MEIDRRLTKININELIDQNGIPKPHISEEDIERCREEGIFLISNCIYNCSIDSFSRMHNKVYDTIKIATIVNEIKNGTYNYNYPIVIWEDYDENLKKSTYDTDGNAPCHIRAFWHCQKDLYASINHSG